MAKMNKRCGGRWQDGVVILTITVGHIQSYIQESREREDVL